MPLTEQQTTVLRVLVEDLPPHLGPTGADEVADLLHWDIKQVDEVFDALDRSGHVILFRFADDQSGHVFDRRVERVTSKGAAAL